MKFIICVLSIVCWCGAVLMVGTSVADVTGLKWKAVWIANTEPDVVGYHLYWRAPESVYNDEKREYALYAEKVITGLVPECDYICVTALDDSLNESECSEEVRFDNNDCPPDKPEGLSIIETAPQ